MAGALSHAVGRTPATSSAVSSPYGYRDIGTFTPSNVACTPPLPAAYSENDILLCICETDSADTITVPGYALLDSVGVSGTDATKLWVFWRRASASETAPTIPDTTDHTMAQIVSIGGLPTSGDWWDDVQKTPMSVAGTNLTWPAVTTLAASRLVLNLLSTGADATGAVLATGPTNASLTGLTARSNIRTTTANGGGLVVATGTLASAGSSGTTTGTVSAARIHALMTIACK